MWFVIVLSSLAIIAVIIMTKRTSGEVPLMTIQQDIEQYDNWAIFADEGVFFDDVLDCRAVPYAEKMLEEAANYDEYLLESDLWRFGFIEERGRLRFVGVFAAEQMYYSGLTLPELQYLHRVFNPQD